MPDVVKIAVRSLVEYVFRSGSIESGFRTSTALTEGTKAHQKVQKQYGEQDQREVYVSAEVVYDEFRLVVDGRCDGLLWDGEMFTVDEIKSTSWDLGLMDHEGLPVHWAQAKFYAYMYAKEHGLGRMGVQLTYVQVNSEAKRQFAVQASFEELEQFVLEVAAQYVPYAALRKRHECTRDESIKQLAFPFASYREGQRKFAGAVYQSIAGGHKLFAKAPTGIGKTMSTIFPSVKAIGEGHLQRLFYLTAKTITRTAAEEAFSILRSQGLVLQTVTITAKEKVCFQEEMRCSKEHCEYADGYYDRINDAIMDVLQNETLLTRPVVEQYARKHRVCPFEFSLDAAYAADAVICDYNYVFDPRVNLKRLFEEQKRQTALLIDEAHNMIDRAREMYSAELVKSDILALQRELKGMNPALYSAVKALNDGLISIRKQVGQQGSSMETGLPEALLERVEVFLEAGEKELMASRSEQGGTGGLLLETYFAAQNFARIAKLYDERYVTLTECSRSEVRVKLMCLDPSYLLGQMGKGYRSHVFFSATLTPLSYYMDALGGGEEDYSVSVPSPFSKEQLDVMIQPLSTRYQDRERSIEPIVRSIKWLAKERPGNYLVFFPSYEYMSSVCETFVAGDDEQDGGDASMRILVQQASMSEEEREAFLDAFQAGGDRTLIGFAVMGGIFSEGIDLVGDRLTGVVVVGVGLPQLGPERNILKDYMNRQGKNGYDYAYVYPGMNKVLQAGGRLIRSETDRGTLLLIDDRYLQPQYQRLLPEEWRDYRVVRQL